MQCYSEVKPLANKFSLQNCNVAVDEAETSSTWRKRKGWSYLGVDQPERKGWKQYDVIDHVAPGMKRQRRKYHSRCNTAVEREKH